jgi:hypothetical protein
MLHHNNAPCHTAISINSFLAEKIIPVGPQPPYSPDLSPCESLRDFVCIHDPKFKRCKARKFSYQYKGPFEIEQNISPLIYKVRMADETSTIIHINRLKRSHKLTESKDVIPLDYSTRKKTRRENCKVFAPRETNETEQEKVDVGTSSHQLTRNTESSESDSYESDSDVISASRGRAKDPDWTPGSSYLQSKLTSNSTADDIAYTLRSRLVSRSKREAETDKRQATAISSPETEHMVADTQENTSPGRAKLTVGHSYNLRNKAESISTKT